MKNEDKKTEQDTSKDITPHFTKDKIQQILNIF